MVLTKKWKGGWRVGRGYICQREGGDVDRKYFA
jgi:hypothetical protein